MRSLAAILLFAALLLSSPETQAATCLPQGEPGHWVVPDNGSTTLASNISGAKTYRVKNQGPDSVVNVIVKNANNEVINTVEVSNGNSVDVGVPDGGDLEVSDDGTDGSPDGNTRGAGGTYQTV